MQFNELNLHPDLQRGLSEAGYETCMPVQEQVLTNAFGGQDLYVQSQTGTGKTAAFLIVIFQRLLAEALLNGKKAIIMVPTRELAVQVEEEAKVLGKYLPFRIGSFYGGVGYGEQERLLRDQVQILVGTPGRVLDLNSSGKMNLMDIAFLVLDEADRMFDMGFYPDLRKLIKVVPPVDRRQTMLFSATLNAWVKNLAYEYTLNPREIEIAPEQVTVEEIDQVLYHVSSEDKMRLLLGILDRENPESAIIFCNTKRYAEIVAKRLRINDIECEFIMGDLPQSKRLRIIEDVKAGKTRFLVATDVAARGLDIEALAMVVNYDLPKESENYVHRIGRTARAGKTGRAITLASEQDVYELPAVERYIGKKIPSETAGEELLGTDKSAGMRIRTDSYGDEAEDRGRRRSEGKRFDRDAGGRRERSRDAGGRRERSRESSDRRESRSGSRGGRREGRAAGERDNPSRDGRGRDSNRTNPAQYKNERVEDRDLSKLSFEERMAYYRQKYVPQTSLSSKGAISAESSESGRREDGTPRDQERGQGRRRRRRRGGKGGRGLAATENGTATPQPGSRRQRAQPGAQSTAAEQQGAEDQDAPKRGILGKLLGLFKKEKP